MYRALGAKVVSSSPGVNTQPRCCRLCSEATTRTVCVTAPWASRNHWMSDTLRVSLTSCRKGTQTGDQQDMVQGAAGKGTAGRGGRGQTQPSLE